VRYQSVAPIGMPLFAVPLRQPWSEYLKTWADGRGVVLTRQISISLQPDRASKTLKRVAAFDDRQTQVRVPNQISMNSLLYRG